MASEKSSEAITICLLGRTGCGKSTLGNVLLGYKPNGTAKSEPTPTRGFQVGPGVELCTKDTELRQGHWLGDPSNPLVTIIDTPGHGGGEDKAESYRQKMVDFIRSLSKVDAIVYLRNADEPRFDALDVEAVRVFSEMFGREQFLNNLIIVISRWSFSAASEMRRRISGATLEDLKASLKVKMESNYPGLYSNLPILALDACYREEEHQQKEQFVNSSCQLFQTIKTLSAIPMNAQKLAMVEDQDRKLERAIKSLKEEQKLLLERHQQEMTAKAKLFSEVHGRNDGISAQRPMIIKKRGQNRIWNSVKSIGRRAALGIRNILCGPRPFGASCDHVQDLTQTS